MKNIDLMEANAVFGGKGGAKRGVAGASAGGAAGGVIFREKRPGCNVVSAVVGGAAGLAVSRAGPGAMNGVGTLAGMAASKYCNDRKNYKAGPFRPIGNRNRYWPN